MAAVITNRRVPLSLNANADVSELLAMPSTIHASAILHPAPKSTLLRAPNPVQKSESSNAALSSPKTVFAVTAAGSSAAHASASSPITPGISLTNPGPQVGAVTFGPSVSNNPVQASEEVNAAARPSSGSSLVYVLVLALLAILLYTLITK